MSPITANPEDKQQSTTVNIDNEQQEANSTSSMLVFYQVRLVTKCRS